MSELYAEGYFVIIPEWVLDADVSDKAVRLYGVLRSYADHRTGVAFPSRRTLAGRLHVADPKAVDRALAELEEVGAVQVQRASNVPGETRTSNRYLLRHTPPGRNATTREAAETQTPSPAPEGAATAGGKYATPPGAQTPPAQGREDPWPGGASAPLTRPNEQNQGSPSDSPAAAQQLRLIEGLPPGLSAAAAFDTFWAAYPRKVGKDAARRQWIKVTRRTDPAVILAALAAYPFDLSRLQYIPYPQTWLNQGRWEDDLAAVNTRNRGSAVTGANYGPRYRNPDPALHPNAFSDAF